MKEILVTIASALPYIIGWIAGNCTRFARWFRDIVTIGYLEGSQDAIWQQTQ